MGVLLDKRMGKRLQELSAVRATKHRQAEWERRWLVCVVILLSACQDLPQQRESDLTFFAGLDRRGLGISALTTRGSELETVMIDSTGETIVHEWKAVEKRSPTAMPRDLAKSCAGGTLKQYTADQPDAVEVVNQVTGVPFSSRFVDCMKSKGFLVKTQSVMPDSEYIVGFRHATERLGVTFEARKKDTSLALFRSDAESCAAQVRSGSSGTVKTYTHTPVPTNAWGGLVTTSTVKTVEPAVRELKACMEQLGYAMEKRER